MAEAVPVFHHHLQVGEPCLMDTAFPSRVTSTNSPTLPQQSRSFGYSYVLEHLKHPQGAMQDAMSFPVQEAIPLELHNSTRRRKKLQRPYFDNYVHICVSCITLAAPRSNARTFCACIMPRAKKDSLVRAYSSSWLGCGESREEVGPLWRRCSDSSTSKATALGCREFSSPGRAVHMSHEDTTVVSQPDSPEQCTVRCAVELPHLQENKNQERTPHFCFAAGVSEAGPSTSS